MKYMITLGLAHGDLHLVFDARRRSLRVVSTVEGRPDAHLVLPTPQLARLVAALHDWPLDLLSELAHAELALAPFPSPPDPRFSPGARSRELTTQADYAPQIAESTATTRLREAAAIERALERLSDAVLAWRAGRADLAAIPALS